MPAHLSRSADETRALGERVGASLFDGAVVLLHGDLGAGKTCFAQGVARGLGVEGPVQSPTFVLVAEYPEARVPLRHADLYRAERPEEIAALALDERVGLDGAWVVEWPERAAWWPEDRLDVHIEEIPGGRRITLIANGPRHRVLA